MYLLESPISYFRLGKNDEAMKHTVGSSTANGEE
jgi:hypothetical protein